MLKASYLLLFLNTSKCSNKYNNGNVLLKSYGVNELKSTEEVSKFFFVSIAPLNCPSDNSLFLIHLLIFLTSDSKCIYIPSQ